MNTLLDNTFYNDFYKRVSIFLTYYSHLFGDARLVLTVVGKDRVYYRGLESMDLPDSPDMKKALAYLDTFGYLSSDKRYFTSCLLEKFRLQTISLSDFGPFDVGNFLSSEETALEGHEKLLMQAMIQDNERASCIVLPLIGMASLTGAMTIFWNPSDFQTPELLKSSIQVLIKMCTREYESMLVFKDLDFLDEAANIQLKHRYDILMHRSQLHPFLSEMGYSDYYRVFGEQFLRYNKKILHVKEKVDKQDIKTAIISIVVDSFAHNVGAHSLTALKWWIQKRSELLEYKFRFGKDQELSQLQPVTVAFDEVRQLAKHHALFFKKIGRHDVKPNIASLGALIKHMPADLENRLLSFQPILRDAKKPEDGNFQPRFPVPIDYAIWPFLEYMRDKSAFWSGVSRDIVYSGEAVSWYDLIWRDFINNPLFLGTIAHSEGIHKLNVWLDIKTPAGDSIAEGLFVQIDLSVIDQEIAQVELLYQEAAPSSKEKAEEDAAGVHYASYGFVRLAQQFEPLRQALEGLPEVFLPNGIIGKHAFYTIIENTLRNVKHFRDEYAAMQKDGINLHLSLQPASFEDKRNGLKDDALNLFKVGVWLRHDIKLVHKGNDAVNNYPVFFRYLSRLQENIVNQYGQPNLGGNSQDKICGAMLLNNTFKSVVETDVERAKIGYWPYVHIASYVHEDYRMTEDDGVYAPAQSPLDGQKLQQDVQRYLERFPAGSIGYITKYLYLWKAENLKIVEGEGGFDARTDNISRFRIIASKGLPLPIARDKFRKQGVIRVVGWEHIEKHDEDTIFDYAYLAWLREWLDWKEGSRLEALISIRNAPVGLITLNESGSISYKNYQTLYEDFNIDNFSGRILELAHGQGQNMGSVCEVRSHGAFLKYFFEEHGFDSLARHQFQRQYKLIELTEAWLTGISIIDNRIFMRIPEPKRKVLEEQLNLYLFPEKDEVWYQQHHRLVSQSNFLIAHLSFIESFDGQRYTANDIDSFVHQEIGPVEELPENFIVVITTGRGRSGWLESIEDPKITFRPIESLVDALEDGLSIQDLFQVKYNLMKVLMGS